MREAADRLGLFAERYAVVGEKNVIVHWRMIEQGPPGLAAIPGRAVALSVLRCLAAMSFTTGSRSPGCTTRFSRVDVARCTALCRSAVLHACRYCLHASKLRAWLRNEVFGVAFPRSGIDLRALRLSSF